MGGSGLHADIEHVMPMPPQCCHEAIGVSTFTSARALTSVREEISEALLHREVSAPTTRLRHRPALGDRRRTFDTRVAFAFDVGAHHQIASQWAAHAPRALLPTAGLMGSHPGGDRRQNRRPARRLIRRWPLQMTAAVAVPYD
jgi:hypothetical protein